MSTQPGATTSPSASSSRRPVPSTSPTAVMRPSFTATSAARRGVPVPSTTVPLRITRSCSAMSPPLARCGVTIPWAPLAPPATVPGSAPDRVPASVGSAGGGEVADDAQHELPEQGDVVVGPLPEGVGGDAVGAVAEALVGGSALAREGDDAAA